MEPTEIPGDWDTLREREPGDPETVSPGAPESHDDQPPVMTLMAASWADLVGMLAVCTAALVAVMALGNRPALPVFGWAATLAVIWWLLSASALVLVRQGTPGMLMAGVHFKDTVDPPRIGWVVAAALAGALTLGLLGLLGSRRSILCMAASSELTAEDSD